LRHLRHRDSVESGSVGPRSGNPVLSVLDGAAMRTLDVLVSLLLLLLCAPAILALALLIKLDSRGPVFYRARRVGRGGATFSMLKFRKMYDGSNGPPLTVASDARLTRVGAVLARTKLDELPQLWNVLMGQMSLVGPRPEDPTLVAVAPEAYETILAVPGGITGFSQLAFAKEGSILSSEDRVQDYLERLFPQKIGLDRMYATKRSFTTNVRVLFWTLAAVFGADVSVDRKTAALRRRRRPKPALAREHVAEPAMAVDELAAGRT
jgi:lipopolysaccharide/colanic/teichoic acid biosynthesis glycosyltransferase